MILSALKVLELNKIYGLVEGLSKRELDNPEGVELELRVGKVYKFKSANIYQEEGEEVSHEGFLGIDKRITPGVEKIADIEEDGNKWIVMNKSAFFLVETMEKINVPKEKVDLGLEGFPPVYLSPEIKPRSTLQRCGIYHLSTTTNPGYSGTLIFGLKNDCDRDFRFQLGARMFKIEFRPVIGKMGRAYDGQWQKGRVSTGGKLEEQI